MKQKFIIKHLASWSPLVQKILHGVSAHTKDAKMLAPSWIELVVTNYANSLPKSIYDYGLEQNGNSWCLWEDDEMVLHLELIEIHSLTEKEPTKFY